MLDGTRAARGREEHMRRVASSSAVLAALVAIAGCGEERSAAAPFGDGGGCAGCHSGPGQTPPFRDPTGSVDPSRVAVGAHDAHLHPNLTAPIACAECHTTPRAIGDPGHLEDSLGDVRFGTLARTGGASPAYAAPTDASPSPTCSSVYCHGAFPGGNGANVLRWVGPADQAACGTCHDLPPQTGRHANHVGRSFGGEAITCNTCHGAFTAAAHVNGVRNVVLSNWNPEFRTCAQACHQARSWGE
jgi:predicted CxxxxCH...CXXCH cytochrome family protein